ncbi:MAG TPA: M15 family metallopeptidase [Rhodocyclaceae bacterium]|nr:M15 family metallopeptidase [Rhodocyclaceae bacterium]
MRGLQACEEAGDLEVAEVGADGRQHLLIPPAAEAWRRLKAAAQDDGISLFIVSAFRSIERQGEIVRRKLCAGMAMDDILAVSAPPGFSEHHTGCAIDVAVAGGPVLEVEFDRSDGFAWLSGHAAEFGYYLSYPMGNQKGYQYEPWHWLYHDAR